MKILVFKFVLYIYRENYCGLKLVNYCNVFYVIIIVFYRKKDGNWYIKNLIMFIKTYRKVLKFLNVVYIL